MVPRSICCKKSAVVEILIPMVLMRPINGCCCPLMYTTSGCTCSRSENGNQSISLRVSHQRDRAKGVLVVVVFFFARSLGEIQ